MSDNNKKFVEAFEKPILPKEENADEYVRLIGVIPNTDCNIRQIRSLMHDLPNDTRVTLGMKALPIYAEYNSKEKILCLSTDGSMIKN